VKKFYYLKYIWQLHSSHSWNEINAVTPESPPLVFSYLLHNQPETYVLQFYAEISEEEYLTLIGENIEVLKRGVIVK
jgi:hypothetical protein